MLLFQTMVMVMVSVVGNVLRPRCTGCAGNDSSCVVRADICHAFGGKNLFLTGIIRMSIDYVTES
jgi:hypothetical protein